MTTITPQTMVAENVYLIDNYDPSKTLAENMGTVAEPVAPVVDDSGDTQVMPDEPVVEPVPEPSPTPTGEKIFFDGTIFSNKNGRFDFPKIKGLYPNNLWVNPVWVNATPAQRDALPDTYPTVTDDYCFIDIEHWKHSRLDGTLHSYTALQNIQRFLTVLNRMRANNPNVKFTYYSIPGFGGSDFNGDLRTRVTMQWKDTYTEVANAQDFLSPNFYANSPNIQEWLDWCSRQMDYFAKFDKKIYPFINWHVKNQREQYWGDEFWNAQLEFCKANCDGAIVWGGYQLSFDPELPFYKVLEQYK